MDIFLLSLVVGFVVEQKRVIGRILDIVTSLGNPLGFSRLVGFSRICLRFSLPYLFLPF
jgi:hypothetical protein